MKDKLKAAWAFWSVRFGFVLMVAPDVLAFILDNFASFAPYIPLVQQPRLINLIGLLIALLRIRRMVQPQ